MVFRNIFFFKNIVYALNLLSTSLSKISPHLFKLLFGQHLGQITDTKLLYIVQMDHAYTKQWI